MNVLLPDSLSGRKHFTAHHWTLEYFQITLNGVGAQGWAMRAGNERIRLKTARITTQSLRTPVT
jgi:hypothetical protein